MEQYLPGPYNDRSRTFIPSNGPIFNPLLKMRLVYIGFRGETTTPAMVARVTLISGIAWPEFLGAHEVDRPV